MRVLARRLGPPPARAVAHEQIPGMALVGCWYICPVAASSRRKRPVALILVLVILVGVPLAAWLLRGTIATSMAASELSSRGLRCDDRFAVELSAGFGEATLAPTRCTHEGGLVEAIELTAPATVVLDGFEPASISADGVRLTLRDRDLRGGSGWAQQLRRINLEQRVAGLIKGLSEMSEMSLPPTTIEHAVVLRGGDELGSIDRLVLTPGSPARVAIDRVQFAAVMGAARLTLSGVSGTASGSTVHLEGDATARAGVALLGSFSTGGEFALDATALDSASPRLRLRSDF